MASGKLISTNDPQVDKALLGLQAGLPSVEALDGVRQIDNLTLVADTPLRVPHGLGRRWRGCLICEQTEHATIKRSRTDADRDKFVTLTASADTKVSILVY